MLLKLLPSMVFLLFVFGTSTHSYSQTDNQVKPLQQIFFDANVASPLTQKELGFIREVYGDNSESDILNRPQRLKDVKNILRNRVEFMHAPNKDLSSFAKLSSVPLFDFYNKSLTRDVILDKTNFNPLKYQFAFDSRQKTKMYLFDNSSYLVVIKSQNPQ
ncbi:hypothetical protein ESY86_04575 [Subsaximicrobium wynnwilliamsii]|uniref:DUF4858 domain-containing protein n=1 Tax=Subsaximicrobium wynnwilliamsii TaxID=291179 RepID=A0A5C6ZKC2_9FLAO|nr:hypothetical protein [Subsaximicrobium wynnwilliamsii]TXD84354.1 hypothetical protein ESY87_04355 [Subsaximicrobium wynnwilliamsii]TXD90035.1 hypothetical protein ESY86_04575 [Subsaximicrobium wynnwilliamsii]TXE04087.1 hypothetical protein ESY88_04350 [Subsaximicrobium wynnwilliamsii]